nr:sigma-70 family RNA polymerase sigma factor [Anaerolineae bacterium]
GELIALDALPGVETQAAARLAAEALRGALEVLPPREQKVLKLRFFEGLSQQEAGERLGVSRQRVDQIEKQALRRLRHPAVARRL